MTSFKRGNGSKVYICPLENHFVEGFGWGNYAWGSSGDDARKKYREHLKQHSQRGELRRRLKK